MQFIDKLLDSAARLLFTLAFIIAHILAFILLHKYSSIPAQDLAWAWFIGFGFSAVELASRYKDDPASVVISLPGVFYMSINGALSASALYLINIFGWNPEIEPDLTNEAQRVADILFSVAIAFGALRSSILKIGQDSEIGLNPLIKKLIEMIDREVDRLRAKRRSQDITRILKCTSYAQCVEVIHYSINIMQNLTPQEHRVIEKAVHRGKISRRSERVRTYSLGLCAYDILGPTALESAVIHLGYDEKNTDPNSMPADANPGVENPETPSNDATDDQLHGFDELATYDENTITHEHLETIKNEAEDRQTHSNDR